MNLSSYLQMPPAPLVPTNTNMAAPQGASTSVGLPAGASLGFDFAQVMARQMEQLAPQERQNLAALMPKQVTRDVQTQDSRPVEDKHIADRVTRDTREARTEENTAEDKANDAPTTQARSRNKNTTLKDSPTDVDSLLAGLMQGAPTTSTTTPATSSSLPSSTTEPAAAELAGATSSLQTIELSPQVRIITNTKTAPSPESLAAFAKSMGLDESAIQNLLAQQPASAETQVSALVGADASRMPIDLTTTPNALQTAMGNILHRTPQSGTVPIEGAVAMQLAAMNASSPQTTVVSGAGLAAPASTLLAPATVPGLTPTDMAAIQQLQITVLPAAPMPMNTAVVSSSTPSTIDMLSLLGSGVDDQDIRALMSRFSDETSGGSNPDQPSSQGETNHFSSFAQTLSSTKNAANANPANAAQATTANMSEVYDQLSDKMATEMAARMHKQLSDGEWKMKFALRPSNLGGVEIQLEMKDGKLDAVFRADNPLTRDLLQNSSQRLKEALGNFGINAGQVNVGQGGGNTAQNGSGNSGKQSQVRDNSSSQVSGTGSASSATSTRNKANASLLDLYA